MVGTKAGGKKVAATNKAKDPNYYAKIGAKGGRSGHTGGFASVPGLAKRAGKLRWSKVKDTGAKKAK